MTRWRSRSSSSTGLVLVDRERRRRRLGQRLGLGDLELDLAGRELRVDVALLAAHDRRPRAETTCSGRRRSASACASARGLGMEDELDEPGAVAQVDEDQAAVVAPAVHPAGHADGRADVARVAARRTRRRGTRSARGGLTGPPGCDA